MPIKPLALWIGLRYTRSKRRSRFVSFISLASIIGIAVSITVLITVLSVINGFDEQIRNRFFAIAPQVTVTSTQNIVQTWSQMSQELHHLPQIQAVAPFVNGQGMLMNGEILRGVNILGIIPDQEKQISKLGAQVVAGNLTSLTPNSFNIMIGKSLAQQLDLKLGDVVSIFVIQGSEEGLIPRFDYQQFKVAAIFSSSQGFGFDQVLVYANMADAQNFLASTQHWNGLHIKLTNLFQASLVNQQLKSLLPGSDSVTDWTEQYGSFFQTLAMQKTMLFVILLFIVAIAVFNLISTLIMVVNEKRPDIAILRTLGATPLMIMTTFIVQGALIGLIGTFFGLIGGLILSYNITGLVNIIQHVFKVQLISESIYFVNYLPSQILWTDVIEVCAISFGLSILATIYPALIAFHTQPAEVLRYE